MNDLIDNLYKAIRYGMSKRKGTIYDLRESGFRGLKTPVFFLSTGRCGTKWFSELLSSDKNCMIEHAPEPDLGVQGKIAYEMQQRSLFQKSKESMQYIQELFLAGREEQIRYTFKTDKQYIETNNHITYFAPAIAELLPESKFVHLYRHPGEFVRSAIRRNYYAENDNRRLKRIVPQENSEFSDQWTTFSQIQKCSWLWFETNRFIEDFKQNISADRTFAMNFNNRTDKNLSQLINWLHLNIPKDTIVKRLYKKVNVQKSGTFSRYGDWRTGQKQELARICGSLADQYGYEL